MSETPDEPGTRYFADTADPGAEAARLRFFEETYGPRDRAALLATGLAPGMRVLEAGPGAGGMLRWLGAEVGESGRVVGVDLNPRFLPDSPSGNIEIITGDVATVPLAGGFDIVYCRFVLMHLPDPLAALVRFRELLRPGGHLVLSDLDMVGHVACDRDHPAAEGFDRIRRGLAPALRDGGIMDLEFARRLPALLDAAGFDTVALGYETHAVKGGSAEADFWKRGAMLSIEAGIAAGTLGQEARGVLPLHDDPGFAFLAPLVATATARRPAV